MCLLGILFSNVGLPFGALRAANADTAREAARLALARRGRIALHHVSTSAVLPPRGTAEAYSVKLFELAGDLRTVFFVKNSSLFPGELV